MRALIFISFLFFASNVVANPIVLEDEDQILRAKEMHEAIGVLSSKVTACVDIENKPIEECACFNLENCDFKPEFKIATKIYCNLKADFSDWNEKSINYKDQKTHESIAIGMIGLERIFGKYCK